MRSVFLQRHFCVAAKVADLCASVGFWQTKFLPTAHLASRSLVLVKCHLKDTSKLMCKTAGLFDKVLLDLVPLLVAEQRERNPAFQRD